MSRFPVVPLLKLSVVACTLALLPALGAESAPPAADTPSAHPVLTGQAAFTDALHESPGTRRHLTWADLPAPAPDQSVDNGPSVVARPADAWPIAPRGFKVELYTTGLDNPRLLRVAPNGDLFLAESETGKIKVFRGVGLDGKPQQTSVFATGLHQPFGIAFYPSGPNPQYVFIGDTDEIVRFPYQSGDLVARSPVEKVADLPGGGRLRGGGHWTRDLVFSPDGARLFASVGSHSNVDDSDTHPEEYRRADVLEFTPTGSFVKVYASGIRNCVGEAINPTTGELWCSTNERDGLGNNLVPDYITHVQEGGFYGWPWFYYHGPSGGLQDPRHMGRHPELQAKVITPTSCSTPTSPRWNCSSTPVRSSPPSSRATALPPSTAPGTAPSAPAMKSSACPCRMATQQANMKTSSPASSLLTAASGAVRWAWRRPRTARCSSPTTAPSPSGMLSTPASSVVRRP